MLTLQTFRALKFFLRIDGYLQALPFHWRPGNKELLVSSDKVSYCLWTTNAVFWLLSFHIGDCFFRGFFINRTIANLSVDAIMMVSWFVFGFWQINLLWRRHDIADLFNQVIRYDRTNEGRVLNAEDPRVENSKIFGKQTDGCDVLITYYNFFVVLWSLTCAILFIQKPENPRYMFHRLELEQTPYYSYFAFMWFLWEWFHQLRAGIIFHFYLYVILIYTNTSNFWLQKLSRPNTKKVKNSPFLYKLVVATKSIRNYKMQQILNAKFNYCCSEIFWPTFNFYNIFNHILSIYVMVKFHDKLPLASFMSFPVSMILWMLIEFVFYPLVGRINYLSIAYIYSWKSQLGTAGRRHFDSLVPLGVKVGSSYTIKKSTVLTVFFIVCTTTMNLIVGF